MATTLNFTKDGNKYVCDVTPSAPTVVQVQMAEKKGFTVYEFIGDMPPVSVFSTNILDNVIFQVDVAEGVSVRMVSWSEVVKAVML